MTDDSPAPEYVSRLWGIFVAAVGLCVGIAVGQFGRPAVAEAAGWSAVAILGAGWLYRRDFKLRWFWVFVASAIVAHVVVVCTVPWPVHHEMNKGDIPLGVGDLILTMVAGGMAQRTARRSG